MKFFPHRVERYLDILDDRIAFVLRIESLLAGSFDCVLEKVEQTADAGCLSLFDQLLAAGSNQNRLHVAARLGEIEKFPAVGSATHLNDAFGLVEFYVRQ